MAHAFPPNYPVQSNWINYGAQFCVYNGWVQTYHPSDKRLEWFVFEYTEHDVTAHNLLDPSDVGRAVRCFKYVPDSSGVSANHGNDVPMIRFAEVLLNRAEALNEPHRSCPKPYNCTAFTMSGGLSPEKGSLGMEL